MTRRPLDTIHRPNFQAIYDLATTLYLGWYFDLRLEEELVRAERYGIDASLLTLRVLDDVGGPLSPERQELNNRLAEVAAAKLRQTDIPGILDDLRYAVLLPHTNKERAATVAERLLKAMRPYRLALGVAAFPEDGASPKELLAAAEAQALDQADAGHLRATVSA